MVDKHSNVLRILPKDGQILILAKTIDYKIARFTAEGYIQIGQQTGRITNILYVSADEITDINGKTGKLVLGTNEEGKAILQIDEVGKINNIVDITKQIYRNVTYDDFTETFTATKEQYRRAYQLWGEEKWEELYNYFIKNNLNGGWPPFDGFSKINQTISANKYDLRVDRFQIQTSLGGGFGSPILKNGEGVESLAYTYDSRMLSDKLDDGIYYFSFKMSDKASEVQLKIGDVAPWFSKKYDLAGEQIKFSRKLHKLDVSYFNNIEAQVRIKGEWRKCIVEGKSVVTEIQDALNKLPKNVADDIADFINAEKSRLQYFKKAQKAGKLDEAFEAYKIYKKNKKNYHFMSLELNKPHTFASKYYPVKLIATEFDEPFYGLTLWRFRLYVKGNIFHHPLLDYDNKFCGLSSMLDNFVFESQKGDYIFIPYGLIVMNINTYELTKYEVSRGTNNDFIQNIFIGNMLIVLNKRSIWIVNLSEKSVFEKTYTFGAVQFKKIQREKDFIKFISWSEQILIYDFKNNSFINEIA